jgi:hypothetical protein
MFKFCPLKYFQHLAQPNPEYAQKLNSISETTLEKPKTAKIKIRYQNVAIANLLNSN